LVIHFQEIELSQFNTLVALDIELLQMQTLYMNDSL